MNLFYIGYLLAIVINCISATNTKASDSPRVLIIQIDNRKLNEYNNDMPELIKWNKAYADKHNYEYRYYADNSASYPVYWMKVMIVAGILATEKDNYDYMMYIDTDAVISDQNKPLDFFFTNTDKSFIYTDGCYKYNDDFNAGLYIWKVNDLTNNLYYTWTNLYKFVPDRWFQIKDNAHKFKRWVTHGEWAQESYEQGAFVEYILPNAEFEPFLKWISRSVLMEWRLPYQSHKKAFAYHFCGKTKENVSPFVSNDHFGKSKDINIVEITGDDVLEVYHRFTFNSRFEVPDIPLTLGKRRFLKSVKIFIIVIGVLGTLLVIFMISTGVTCCKLGKQNRKQSSHQDLEAQTKVPVVTQS